MPEEKLEIALSNAETKLAEAQSILCNALGSPSISTKDSVLEAFCLLRSLPASEAKAECLLDIVRYCYLVGQSLCGVAPAIEAVKIARSSPDRVLGRTAFMLHGVVSFDTDNLLVSIDSSLSAWELAQREEDGSVQGIILCNIGTALLSGGLYADAISCWSKAIGVGKGVSESELRAPTTWSMANAALGYWHLGEPQKALRLIEKAAAMSPDPVTPVGMLSRVILERTYAFVLIDLGLYEKAKERVGLATAYAHASQSKRAEMNAAIAERFLQVHEGGQEGVSQLLSLLEQARENKLLIRETLVSLVKANEFVGRPREALPYLKDLIHHDSERRLMFAVANHSMYADGCDENSAWLSLQDLAVAAELREDHSGQHTYRVGKLAFMLALETGSDIGTARAIELAARLHDIGKIGLPDELVLKRESLAMQEKELLSAHAKVGVELIERTVSGRLPYVLDVVGHHHENWDGSGYPEGLVGTAIPLAARVVAIADTFDALTHARCYRPARTVQEAMRTIVELGARRFDPELIRLFDRVVAKIAPGSVSELDAALVQPDQSSPLARMRALIQSI
jgi:putative two-component system response regulator